MSEGKKSVYKPKQIGGYPEWLPEVRIVEQQWLDHIRRVFESYGFCSIETPSVEELDALNAKGEIAQEVYVLERLHKEEGDKEARLALHFDQTVPLARYTAQHFNELVFPFKRYQMQRVWRGERPKAGRFREFTQCDIDVINIDSLPLHFDAEMPAIIWEVLNGLPGMEKQKIQIQVSNRKILLGLLQAWGVTKEEISLKIMRALDKMGKVQLIQIHNEISLALADGKNIDVNDKTTIEQQMLITSFVAFASHKYKTSKELREQLTNWQITESKSEKFQPEITNETFKQGVDEVCFILDSLQHLPEDSVVADLSIVRGLDYYTGTVYETRFIGDSTYGSICSGGRYDDLASQYINKKLPGVGISIGFSRLFAYLLEKGALPVGVKSPAQVLMILPSDERRAEAAKTAQTLRTRGFNVELYHAAKKIPDQLKYASRKGIPFVWFPPFEDGRAHEVKNMTTGEQKQADPATWTPDKENINAAA